MTDPTPVAFFNAAQEAAARELHAQRHTNLVWHGHCLTAASAVLNAALEALPERSKAILALAALSDEELRNRIVHALSGCKGCRAPEEHEQEMDEAVAVLTALGLPVAERETTG